MEALIPNTQWALLFIGLGLVLMFFEIFIPTAGVLGVVAAAAIGAGIYQLFQLGHTFLGVTSIFISLGVYALIFLYMIKRLKFETVQDSKAFTAVDASSEGRAGKKGTTETPLRPAGVARIDGHRVDVVAATGFIEKNIPVRVVETSGNRVVVRSLS